MKLILNSLVWAAVSLPTLSLSERDVLVQFGGNAHDVEYDHARSRAYVSIPSQGKVVVIDTNSWLPLNDISVAPGPRGLALSIDGTRLFVAKFGVGSVAVIDLNTFNQSEIQITTQLGDSRTWDVIEAQPNRLYVSANAIGAGGGVAWIVQVELDNGNAANRVASSSIIRCAPTFEVSRDLTTLYVGDCLNPQSVHKLDLTQPDAPLVAETADATLSGVNHLDTNPDGSRLHLASGQILNTSNLALVGQVGAGLSRFDTDPNRLYVFALPNTLQVWNVNTLTPVTSRTLPCLFLNSTPRQLLVLPGGTGFLVLSGSSLCGVDDIDPCATSVTPTCDAAPNSVGVGAMLSLTGEPNYSHSNMVLTLDGAPPGQSALFLFGDQGASIPFGDGRLCISPFSILQRLGSLRSLDANGHTEMALNFLVPPFSNGPITPDSTWHFQAWYRDGQGPGATGLNTSNALRVHFCP